jgi:hypothetical protein
MKFSPQNRSISPFWLVLASVALTFSWLLPNHTQPWLGFHGDAWAALMMVLVATVVLWLSKLTVDWHTLTVLVAFVAMMPFTQHIAGLVPMFGTAWINTAYLVGFLLALLTGAAWEKEQPGQCADYLFLSIGLAAVGSFGLQLYQLSNLEPVGAWTLYSSGSRHYANMAQPNLLATLQLLGLLGCCWGYLRGHLGPIVSTGIAALLLLGVALTESRTGWLNVALLVFVFTLFGRRLAPSNTFVKVVTGLALYFTICVLLLPNFYEWLWSESVINYRPTTSDPRWAAWAMFFKAATHRALFGFGWGQLGQAQFLMLDEKMWLGASMLQSHNLILDLILWNGFAIGLGIVAVLVWWCWTVVRRVRNQHHLTMMSVVMVMGTHAMLEYPLQYAYFLLPFGLIAGCLNSALGFRVLVVSRRWLNGAVLVLGIGMLAVTIRDYLRVERSFYGLRFEHKKVETDIPRTPPDVLALSHFRDYMVLARLEPHTGMRPEEITNIRDLVSTIPSAFGMYKFASVLAMNDRPEEAQVWLRRMCQVTPAVQCQAIKGEWASKSLTNKSIAAVPWPVMPN